MWNAISQHGSLLRIEAAAVRDDSQDSQKRVPRTVKRPGQAEPGRLLQAALCLFVLTLPFDTVNFPTENFALTKFGGIVFLLVCLAAGRNICFRRPSAAFWFLAAYAGVYVSRGVFKVSDFGEEIATRGVSLVQLLCLFWMASNLFRFPRVANRAWFSFILGCAALAMMQVLHIGSSPGDATQTAATAARVTSVGANANQLCGVLALAALALVGLCFGQTRSKIRPRWVAFPLLAVLGAGMLLTVSRGGMVALTFGLLVFLFSYGDWRVRLRNVVMVACALTIVLAALLSSPGARTRFASALEGNLAKREFLYPAALTMIREKPLFGWGPVANRYELGRRTFWAYHHDEPDTHNLLLWLGTESGALGLVTYLGCLALCLSAAWRSRKGRQGIQPLAMLACLLAVNTSGTWIYYKLSYLVLAYALASADPISLRRPRFRGRLSRSAVRRPDPQNGARICAD